MGGIQHRMRVQAQEDVYEKTRASMTIAAQNKTKNWWVDVMNDKQIVDNSISKNDI